MIKDFLAKKNVVFFAIITIICALCAGLIGVGLNVNLVADAEEAASVSVWDGASDTSWYRDGETEFYISTAQQLAGMQTVINQHNYLSGATVYLLNDIDLGGNVTYNGADTAAGDGAKTGYDLPVIKAMAQACSAKIVASGGAGKMEHFLEAVQAGARILLAASVFHFHMIDIGELKAYLKQNGVAVK